VRLECSPAVEGALSGNGSVLVKSTSAEMGDNEGTLDASVDGDDTQIAFNGRYLRDALEAIDRAWAARTITADRIAALRRQLVAEQKTIAIYRREYEIGRRKLIVPVGVLVGNAGWPACVPGGSPLRAPSPASNTVVAGPPGGGIVMVGAAPTFRCGVAGMTAKAIPLCPSGPSRSSGIKPL